MHLIRSAVRHLKRSDDLGALLTTLVGSRSDLTFSFNLTAFTGKKSDPLRRLLRALPAFEHFPQVQTKHPEAIRIKSGSPDPATAYLTAPLLAEFLTGVPRRWALDLATVAIHDPAWPTVVGTNLEESEATVWHHSVVVGVDLGYRHVNSTWHEQVPGVVDDLVDPALALLRTVAPTAVAKWELIQSAQDRRQSADHRKRLEEIGEQFTRRLAAEDHDGLRQYLPGPDQTGPVMAFGDLGIPSASIEFTRAFGPLGYRGPATYQVKHHPSGVLLQFARDISPMNGTILCYLSASVPAGFARCWLTLGSCGSNIPAGPHLGRFVDAWASQVARIEEDLVREVLAVAGPPPAWWTLLDTPVRQARRTKGKALASPR